MKRAFLRTVGVTILSALVHSFAYATTSLSFEGGGYWIDLAIGNLDKPVIGGVRFHAPDDPKGVSLSGNYVVEVFDIDRKELHLVYAGGIARVPPFTLTVQGDKATLTIGNQRVHATFDWSM
jgi:hypothetical protein